MDTVKDTIIAALAEKVERLEKLLSQRDTEISTWKTIYRDKNERIAELEMRIAASKGRAPNGSEGGE